MYEHPLSRGLRVVTTWFFVLFIPIFIPAWYFSLVTTATALGLLVGSAGLILGTTATFAATSATPQMWRGLRLAVKQWGIVTLPAVLLAIGIEAWRRGGVPISTTDFSAVVMVLGLMVALMIMFFYRYLRWAPGRPIPDTLVR